MTAAASWWPAAGVALLPVLMFLAALFHLDSYKLLAPSAVLGATGAGVAAAGASYLVNGYVLARLDIEVLAFSRFVAPWIEEIAKALVIVALVRAHRVGFLVDAAIYGFAVGSGFALAENLYYLNLARDAGLGTWIVRGFGTALMHGGCTALFAIAGLSRLELSGRSPALAFVPALVLAALLHAGFNHLSHEPQLATLATLLTLPALMAVVFQRSERALRDWLGPGFDADAQMLALISSGGFADSPPGRYLQALKSSLQGPLVADALCYLRLYTELALRAKGVLMMRENGFEPRPMDAATRSRFAELRYLEHSLGATGLRALRPLLRMRRQELWQLYMLEAAGSG